jgi:hypothetical protein
LLCTFQFSQTLKLLQTAFEVDFLDHYHSIEDLRARFKCFLFKSRGIFGFIFQIKR